MIEAKLEPKISTNKPVQIQDYQIAFLVPSCALFKTVANLTAENVKVHGCITQRLIKTKAAALASRVSQQLVTTGTLGATQKP